MPNDDYGADYDQITNIIPDGKPFDPNKRRRAQDSDASFVSNIFNRIKDLFRR